MQSDRLKWNEKYATGVSPVEPSAILQDYIGLARPGFALDIAAGMGRNSLFLANYGFHVHSVDISDIAMQRLSGLHPHIHPLCADLDRFDIPERRYNLILNIRYLNRRLFPWIAEGLLPGGVLIFETYVEGSKASIQKPSCRDYWLRKNELLHAFLGLHILFYQEGKIEEEAEESAGALTASLVAVRR